MSINIYVGNLPYDMSISELTDLFKPFGEVTVAKIISDRYSGKSKGFGFVEMPNRPEGLKAIDGLNRTEVRGRTVKVSEARQRKERGRSYGPQSGGHGNRGGFSGGGYHRGR